MSAREDTYSEVVRMRSISLKKIYERYSRELHRYLTGAMRGNAVEAEDITQATFMKLASQDTPDEVENPRAYLFQTAKNLMVDKARKKARYSRMMAAMQHENIEKHDPITPEQIIHSRQALKGLEAVIVNLPPRQRRVFILSRVHNLSYEEIAAETGLTKAGVKQHIVRALAVCRSAQEELIKKAEKS